jgi:hypothetical protein
VNIKTAYFCFPKMIVMFSWVGVMLVFSAAVSASSRPSDIVQQVAPPPAQQFTPRLIPVGLLVNGRTKLESFYVLGQENGENAVLFSDWLLPFDELSKALGWKVKEIDGQLEISSSGVKFRLAASKIALDPKLGRVITVRDLQSIPGYTFKFNIYQYAIEISRPEDRADSFSPSEQPVVLEGLPVLQPNPLGLTILQQRINASGSTSSDSGNRTTGELLGVGSVGDAGWYIRVDQPDFTNLNTWNISDLTVLRQRAHQDLLLGSQTSFWSRGNRNPTGTYWGTTTVFRHGFEPPQQFTGGEYSLNDRLQSRRTSRSISGQAAPGTVVQLVRNDRSQILQEVLVDSSGIFRFNNVVVSGNLDDTIVGRDYQLLLYPSGQLTTPPIIRNVTFSSFSGQIPVGAEAWVVSAGANRVTRGSFGDFDRLQGGVLYRRGLTDALTVGAGVAYDLEVRGVGEVFWQPSNSMEISLATVTDSQQWDHLGRFSYRPSNEFYLQGTSDRLSTSANAYWQLGTNFAALSSYDSQRGASIGGQYFTSSPGSSTFAQADVDDRGRIRTSFNQRWDSLQATYQSNEVSQNAQLIYSLNNTAFNGGEIALGYQTSSSSQSTSALWRYRSPERTVDGRSLWQTELGYVWGNSGGGILASADLNFLTGVQLRASYRGATNAGGQDNYAVELTTTLFTNGGIRGTSDRIEEFRSLGKVVIRPFLDRNQNGRQDPGEDSYWDPLLIRVNQKPISQFRPQVIENSGELNIPNGSYRIDIDPAGYPVSFSSRIEALRVEIVSGGVTNIAVPLIPAYLVTGFVKSTTGEELAGARVEAINTKTKVKIVSITNDAGFYTLDNLEQGEYQITVGGISATPNLLKIESNSPPNQEINLTVKIPESQPKTNLRKEEKPEVKPANSLSWLDSLTTHNLQIKKEILANTNRRLEPPHVEKKAFEFIHIN